MPITTPSFTVQRSAERGAFDFGWLQTKHSFSFGDYFDPKYVHWGALRVFNDDVVQPGKGFGTHPHRDMEILTYVIDGELEHKDSMGNIGVVRPGGVQYLSAGTGITHSEYNHSHADAVHFVQMWVLPHAAGLKPRYGQVDFTRDERLEKWLPIASGRAGVAAKIAIWQDAAAYVARVERATLTYEVAAGRFAYLFVAKGDATANDAPLGAGDAVRIEGPLTLEVRAADGGDGAELVLWDVPPVE
jgi:redox-sensitive bicupin YhaK (pirin superfamily)